MATSRGPKDTPVEAYRRWVNGKLQQVRYHLRHGNLRLSTLASPDQLSFGF
jgi:hypothetical protein